MNFEIPLLSAVPKSGIFKRNSLPVTRKKRVFEVKMISVYPVRLRNVNDIRKALQVTTDIYRKAVHFLSTYASTNDRIYQYVVGKRPGLTL